MSRRRQRTFHPERRLLVVGAAVVVLTLCATYVSTISVNGSVLAPTRTVRAELPGDGPIVKPGDEVRLAGKRVGQVRSVAIGRTAALATLQVHTDALRSDAGARIRLRGLAGAVTLELEPGSSLAPLANGGTIPRARTTTGTQVTDVVAGFERATRASLGRTLARAGAALAGRGDAINRALAAGGPALQQVTPLVRALRPEPGATRDLIDQAKRALAPVSPPGSSDLGSAVVSAESVASPAAAHAGALAAILEGAPALEKEAAQTLPGADRLLATLQHTTSVLTPGIRALRASLPALHATELAARDLPSLDRVASEARPVLAAAAPVLSRLWLSAAAVGAAGPPLVKLADYLIPYGHELVEAPAGFTRWGAYRYSNGQASGHRAVRFTMVFTCAKARDPYPRPGAAEQEKSKCRR
jgi:virulence factor Mce-like protein